MDITVTLTANEAMEMGIWEDLCQMKKISIWAVNEGTISGDHEFTLTKEETYDLGITIKGDKE